MTAMAVEPMRGGGGLSQNVRVEGAPASSVGRRNARGLGGAVAELSLILKEDPDLAATLPDRDRAIAENAFRAVAITVLNARWEPPELDPQTSYGLLILEGLLGRRVRVRNATATELLSSGDILRPWDEPCKWEPVPPDSEFRVLSAARIAILDERITRLIGRWPELVVSFSGRLLRRARNAEYVMAVGHLRRVEDRLLATLWHLASSWGRVTPSGVAVPFALTHELLGEIIGARRPSVTAAMQHLQQRDLVRRVPGGGYILTREG
jgi:CRP-like cAMP-binding protein